MDTTTIVFIIFAAGDFLLTFLVYMGWKKEILTNRVLALLKDKPRLIPLLLISGFLFSGIAFYRTFDTYRFKDLNEGEFEEIKDRRFLNERVTLDGRRFIRCQFRNVTIVYNGTAPVQLRENGFYDSLTVSTENPAVLGAFALIKGLDMVKRDIPLLGPNFEPDKQVNPAEKQEP